MPAPQALFDRATLAFLAFAAGLLWLRVWGLMASPLDLHFDEAQYWSWSQTLEWGYFSKPPLIAWAIAGVTSIFGDAEWAVRLSAPVAHTIGALALFALGRSMFGPWQGFWAGITWLVLPAVWLSSGIISTDALLLPLWSVALFALWRLIATRAWFWAAFLGVIVGLGLLTKYAMLYFFMCAALAAWWAPPARQVLVNARGAVAVLVALAIWSPNLYWNLQHHFATVSHTASNARFSGPLFNPDELLEFITSQIGVLGPVLFALMIGLFLRSLRRAAGLTNEDKLLLAFILPPLLLIMAQAFFSRANANWAATAYPAAAVWIAGNLFAWRRGPKLLFVAALVNALLGGAFAALAINPAIADQHKALANSIKRARGWEETAHEVAMRATAAPGDAPFTAVLVDHRSLFYELSYYWREARRAGEPLPPLRMWLLNAEAGNSAEANDPMRVEEGARVLVVNVRSDYLPKVAGDFTAFRHVEHISIPLGGGKDRDLDFSVGEGFAPAPRTEHGARDDDD